ncbi:MAG: ATP-binding protein [Desulfovibrionales bacterium]|nr:ATP-binding protein [Desulfovibrionales bacterium]
MHINLKLGQKIVCFLAVIIFMISAIEIAAYRSLQRFDKRLQFVEMADDLTKNILEMRRVEKNYFLYHDEASLVEALDYVHRIKDLSYNLRKEIMDLAGDKMFIAFKQDLNSYEHIVGNLLGEDPRNNGQANELRTTGRRLYEFTKGMARLERLEISSLLERYQKLSLGAIVFIVFFAAVSYSLVRRHIVKPLGQIEATTRKIANGDFSFVPEIKSHDEVGSCIETFNRMVKELKENQDMLVQTKKLASLGTLTSGVAHEINNPLNNISTSCQILIEELDSSDKDYLRKLLRNISVQADKARDLVRNLLEFSREKVFAVDRVRLRELVEDSLELVQSDLSSNVETSVQIADDIPDPMVDRSRLQQAFLNIILNAIHAMPDGGTLSVKARTEDGTVFIDISDTGVGIPPENLNKIFDPFFTTKEVGQGTGLGLSVSYGIVKKHGGRLTVKSKEGKGTIFTIALPLEQKKMEKAVV